MTHCEWLEEHGFINIKDHWNGNWNYRTYQKIYEICKNKNGTHDSFTLK